MAPAPPPDAVLAGVARRPQASGYCSSFSTLWGSWFACASMAVPDWERIWSFVKLTVSAATSTSRMRLSAAEMFSS